MTKKEGTLPVPIVTFYFDQPTYTGPRGPGSLGKRRARKCGKCRKPGHRAPDCTEEET